LHHPQTIHVFIGCYDAVRWSLCWRGLSVTFSGLVY